MQYKAVVLAALASLAFGQEQPQTQNLTTTLGNITSLSNLTSYLQLVPELAGQLTQLQNITLFAPNNDAFAEFINETGEGALSQDAAAQVAAIFSYHAVQGAYYNFTENATFVPTLLSPEQNAEYTNVTGGQVVEVTTGDGTVAVYSGLLRNATVVESRNFTGGVIHVIDRVLTVPLNVSETAIQLNLTSIVGALSAVQLAETVDTTPDLTIFVPSNEAFQAIGGSLANLTTENITQILQYHVIQGTVAYSANLENGSFPTLEGTNVTISIIEDEVFVNSARVIIPDVLVANGVVHVIDGVLNPANATAAPNPADEDGEPAFGGASSASDIPFTSGVRTPTSSVATESAAGTSTSAALAPKITAGAMGAAALFGAVVVNL